LKLNIKLYYKYFFILSLVWITIDGVFRKWLLPNLSSQLFIVKYLLFSISYFLLLLQNHKFKSTKSTYQILILSLSFWCFFQIINNPYNAPLLVLVFGIITYLFFIPLTFSIPKIFTSLTSFERFTNYIAYLSIPIFAIGIMQYYLPVDHALNYLVNADQLANKVGGFTRSLSIFTFVKIYDVYLIFCLTLFISYIYYLSYIGKSIKFISVLLGFGVINLIMTGSRLQVFQLGFNAIIISFFVYFKIPQLRKHILILLLFSSLLAIIFYNTSTTVQESTDAFTNRVEQTEKVGESGKAGYTAKDRVYDRVNIFAFSDYSGWLGLGIGTTYQGTGNFLKDKIPEIYYEEEGERIVLELGIVGGIIMILLRLSIFLYALNVLLKMKHIKYIIFSIPFVLYLFPPIFFLTNVTFNYFDGFAYWLSFSLLLALEKSYINTILSTK